MRILSLCKGLQEGSINNDASEDFDLSTDAVNNGSFEIHVEGTTCLVFTCLSPLHKTLWLQALKNAVVGTWHRTNKIRNINSIDNAGWQHSIIRTSIYSVICAGDVDILRQILERFSKNHEILQLRDDYGLTAIHYSVIKNQMPCLSLLLQHHFDPHAKDNNMYASADYGRGVSKFYNACYRIDFLILSLFLTCHWKPHR